MKQVLVTMCLLSMWVTGAAAQATTSSSGPQVTPIAMGLDLCTGDHVEVSGDLTTETNTIVDANGNTHVRMTMTSSNATAVGTAGDQYVFSFVTKMVDVSGDDSADEQTVVVRMKLIGPGPLANQIIFAELHFTNPPDNTGVNVAHMWSKCTGN